MLENLIREKRSQAHAAFLAAKGFGDEIRAKQEKGESPAEAEEKFNKAFAEGQAHTKVLEGLERQKQNEDQLKTFTTPVGGGIPHQQHTGASHQNAAELKGAHERAWRAYVKHGEGAARAEITQHMSHLGPTEMHMLLGTQGDLGGFTIPEDFRNEIIKDLAGFTVVRPLARVVPTNSSVLVFPSIKPATVDADMYTSGYTGAWQPEGWVSGGTVPPQQTQPQFSQERIPVHSWQPNAVEISPELLEDSAVPLDSVLSSLIAEVRGLDEDAAFINGNGVGKPMGLLAAATGLPTIASGNASLITYNGMIDLFVGLPAQYRQNATFLMNSLGYGSVLKLADNQSYPIITPNTLPNTLWGRPIRFSEFLPDIAANAKPVIFGDFRYYVIADRMEMRILRLTERFAPNIGLLPRARVGGQVVRKNAFRVLSVAAA